MAMGPSVAFGREPQVFFEHAGKIKFTPESAFPGNGFDRFGALNQHGGGFIKTLAQHKPMRRFVMLFCEDPHEMLQ